MSSDDDSGDLSLGIQKIRSLVFKQYHGRFRRLYDDDDAAPERRSLNVQMVAKPVPQVDIPLENMQFGQPAPVTQNHSNKSTSRQKSYSRIRQMGTCSTPLTVHNKDDTSRKFTTSFSPIKKGMPIVDEVPMVEIMDDAFLTKTNSQINISQRSALPNDDGIPSNQESGPRYYESNIPKNFLPVVSLARLNPHTVGVDNTQRSSSSSALEASQRNVTKGAGELNPEVNSAQTVTRSSKRCSNKNSVNPALKKSAQQKITSSSSSLEASQRKEQKGAGEPNQQVNSVQHVKKSSKRFTEKNLAKPTLEKSAQQKITSTADEERNRKALNLANQNSTDENLETFDVATEANQPLEKSKDTTSNLVKSQVQTLEVSERNRNSGRVSIKLLTRFTEASTERSSFATKAQMQLENVNVTSRTSKSVINEPNLPANNTSRNVIVPETQENDEMEKLIQETDSDESPKLTEIPPSPNIIEAQSIVSIASQSYSTGTGHENASENIVIPETQENESIHDPGKVSNEEQARSIPPESNIEISCKTNLKTRPAVLADGNAAKPKKGRKNKINDVKEVVAPTESDINTETVNVNLNTENTRPLNVELGESLQACGSSTNQTKPKKSQPARKKKLNDTYMSYLSLEKSTNKKSLKRKSSGIKRKLYSQELEKPVLIRETPPRRTGDQETLNGSENGLSLVDNDGFKIPDLVRTPRHNRETVTTNGRQSPRKSNEKNVENIQESAPQEKSAMSLIEDHVRKLNQTQTAKTVVKEAPQPKNKKRKKTAEDSKLISASEKRMIDAQIETTGVRRSTRTKREPMTYWKVHKEPLSVDTHNFYMNLYRNKKPNNSSMAKRPAKPPKKPPPLANIDEAANEEADHQPEAIHSTKTRNTRKNNRAEILNNEFDQLKSSEVVNPPNELETVQNNTQSAPQLPPINNDVIEGVTSVEIILPPPTTSVSSPTHKVSAKTLGRIRRARPNDSGIQETSESAAEPVTKKSSSTARTDAEEIAHINFLKKFTTNYPPQRVMQLNREANARVNANDDFTVIDCLAFEELCPGLEFAMIPNTGEAAGYLRLQPKANKPVQKNSRKFLLTLMLIKESVTVVVNKETVELKLGDLDTIQIFPGIRYGIFNNSTLPAIVMTLRTPQISL